jgi:hypothetical protein
VMVGPSLFVIRTIDKTPHNIRDKINDKRQSSSIKLNGILQSIPLKHRHHLTISIFSSHQKTKAEREALQQYLKNQTQK